MACRAAREPRAALARAAGRAASTSPTRGASSCAAHLFCGDDGALHVDPNAATGSHRLRAAAESNALIVVPEGPQRLAAGEVVEVLPLYA